MKRTFFTSIILLVCIAFFLSARGVAQNNKDVVTGRIAKKLTLEQAAMCEEIKEFAPYNSAVVFSIRPVAIKGLRQESIPMSTHIN